MWNVELNCGVFVNFIHDLHYGILFVGPFTNDKAANKWLDEWKMEQEKKESINQIGFDEIKIVNSYYIQLGGKIHVLNESTEAQDPSFTVGSSH